MSSSAENIAKRAKTAFQNSQLIPSSERVSALHAIRAELITRKDVILDANKEDLQTAQEEVDAGRLSQSLLSRLDLNQGDKWESMLQGVLDVAALPEPMGRVSYATELDAGLELYRVSCPIGVLLVIFEARPEVVVNIAALAIKSGNAAILKGGKESSRTTQLLSQAIAAGLAKTSLPDTYIQTVQTRAEVSSLLTLDQYIDLVIPRGSKDLVRAIQQNTRISVIGHADGLCSIYLDESADLEKSKRIVFDSKTNYPSACNAVETLIVHESLLTTVWPEVAKVLLAGNVQLLCDPPTLEALAATSPQPQNLKNYVKPSNAATYDIEHVSLVLSVIALPSLQSAMEFINLHGSHHTDCIITESETNASAFCQGVDSSSTYINASTRFADGFRYGFGTEVGIATGRIHARGPVGLEGLVTYKYKMRSKDVLGHIVGEFGAGKKEYSHKAISASSSPF